MWGIVACVCFFCCFFWFVHVYHRNQAKAIEFQVEKIYTFPKKKKSTIFLKNLKWVNLTWIPCKG